MLHADSGPLHALDFFLVGNTVRRMYDNFSPTKFILGLTSKDDYIDIDAIDYKTIKPGYHVTYKVQAMEISPSPGLRSIHFKRRGCRFHDEIDGLEIFQLYSQSACEFEHKIKSAENFCQCVPWHFPSTRKNEVCKKEEKTIPILYNKF